MNNVMPEARRRKPSSETGFTLIELLVVIAIILIVASFALPAYNRILTRSHEAVLRDDLFTMRQMINRYTLDNHQPPESLDDLVKRVAISERQVAQTAGPAVCGFFIDLGTTGRPGAVSLARNGAGGAGPVVS